MLRSVQEMLEGKVDTKKEKEKEKEDKHKGMIVVPYVSDMTEKVARGMKKRRICTPMKPNTTPKNLVAHPKEKSDPKEDCIPSSTKGVRRVIYRRDKKEAKHQGERT